MPARTPKNEGLGNVEQNIENVEQQNVGQPAPDGPYATEEELEAQDDGQEAPPAQADPADEDEDTD
jgi:hypothetical protein